MHSEVFFQPADGWVGDLIPINQDDELWLYYLREIRATPKPGTPWALVKTRDLVTFEDCGVSLPHGTISEPDFNAYTGSVIRDDNGVFHLFYTGQNPTGVGEDGLPLQLVMHATSDNAMATWVKHPEHTFGAPEGYETADWRDPFVFRDDATGMWRMLMAARHRTGPERRRGVIAQLTSEDLATWTPTEPFWDPRRYITHECPEVFKIGDWWYLVYSEFSDAFVTRYRMATRLDGPWLTPEYDSIDGRAFYAAKSADFHGRRIFAGWIATRDGNTDDGAWQWAGTMSLLEARQRPDDGSLAFSLPQEILDTFTEDVAINLPTNALDAIDAYACAIAEGPLPKVCHIHAEIEIEADTTECGLLLRTSADGDHGYVVRLEPKRNRLVFDRWPRRSTGTAQWQISGDVPHVIELERPADLAPGSHTLDVVLDHDKAIVVLDSAVCLSTRLYDDTHARLGIFVAEGAAKFRELTIRSRAATQ